MIVKLSEYMGFESKIYEALDACSIKPFYLLVLGGDKNSSVLLVPIMSNQENIAILYLKKVFLNYKYNNIWFP